MRPSLQSELPVDRLRLVLVKVSFADHIRQLQTAFRDNADHQTLANNCRKFLFDKSDSPFQTLTTKSLVDILVDGRARAVALSNLCYGDDSIEKCKCLLDFANACALQGWWEIAEERIRLAAELLNTWSRKVDKAEVRRKRQAAVAAAKIIRVIFSILRDHCARHGGKVRQSYIAELVAVLGQFFPSDNNINTSTSTNEEVPIEEFPGQSMESVTRIAASLSKFFSQNPRKSAPSSDSLEEKNSSSEVDRSFMMMVHFFRCKSDEMKKLFGDVERYVLPHHIALLDMPFLLCDPKDLGVVHPLELAAELSSFPAVMKLLSGGIKLAQQLHEMVNNAPAINTFTSQDKGAGTFLTSSDGLSKEEQAIRLFHDLPLTREEYICSFLLESEAAFSRKDSVVELANRADDAASECQLDILKLQIQTLQGVSHIYTNKLAMAEEFFQSALALLAKWGLQSELVACELYNSIAQMMIMKHKQWFSHRQKHLRDISEEWLQSEEAKFLMKQQYKELKKQYDYTSKPVTKSDLEYRARSIIYKEKLANLVAEDARVPAPHQSLEAAYRYLVMAFDISETVYGPYHPMVGTASLAVASVQNLAGKYEDTKEWLTRSLKGFEKFSQESTKKLGLPSPQRAIAFTQTQLSQVLQKLGHLDEALQLLSQASSFHLAQAKHGLLLRRNQTMEKMEDDTDTGDAAGLFHLFVPAPILKGSPLQEEVNLALELIQKELKLISSDQPTVGQGPEPGGWRGLQLVTEVANLTEEAFGWDSIEAAIAYKQVGSRSAELNDWSRAVRYFKLSGESYVTVLGPKDSKTVSVLRALGNARKNRANGRRLKAATDDEIFFSADPKKESSDLNNSKSSKSNPPSGRSVSVGKSHNRSAKSMQTRMKSKKEIGKKKFFADDFESPPSPKNVTNNGQSGAYTEPYVKRRSANLNTANNLRADFEEDFIGSDDYFESFVRKGIDIVQRKHGQEDDEELIGLQRGESEGEEEVLVRDGKRGGTREDGEEDAEDYYEDDLCPVSPLSNSDPNSPDRKRVTYKDS